jgi:integrase
LIMQLGPAVTRREKNLSKLTAAPRFVKLNTNALLRMDPLNKAKAIDVALKNGSLTIDEGRALDDRPPLTPEQIEQFLTLYGKSSGGNALDSEPAVVPT